MEPNLSTMADALLDAVAQIQPETRYEEKAYGPAGARIEGTNAALRTLLGASPCDIAYPVGGGLCDLCFRHGEHRLWVEVKQAWTWMTYTRPAGANPSLMKHLLGAGGQSALHDATVKLPRLVGCKEADVIGMLVIALDSQDLPFDGDLVHQLEHRAGLDQQPWAAFRRERWISRVPGYETIGIQPFLWLRPTSGSLVPA